MKVKDLIKELKKMLQNLEVAMTAHDNADYEVQGWVCYTEHIIKPKEIESEMIDLNIVPNKPEWVVLG